MTKSGKYNLGCPYISVDTFDIQMNKITFLAMFAILAGAGILAITEFTITNSAIAQTTMDNATTGGNMTAGNMTAGNMTAGNMTGSISQCLTC